MFRIEFVAQRRDSVPPEVLDRMTTDMTSLPSVIAHAKSLLSNVIVQRIHKPIPHGFRILDAEGAVVADWSIDDT